MANGQITKEEARRELARRELARRELVRTGQEVTPESVQGLAKTGFIRETPGVVERTVGALPQIGQAVGGLVGAGAGARVKAPIRGQVAGGVIGRAGGQILNKLLRGDIRGLSETEKKTLGKDLIATAGSELITGGIGGVITGAGKGALEALIGKRVTERGLKEGFKRFLDPKFYQDRVPKTVVEKTSKFFDKIDNVLGKKVQQAVLKKTAIGRTVKFQPIKEQAKKLLKETGAETIEDLGSPTISKAQRTKLKSFMNMIERVQQEDIKLSSLWKIRKNMDKVRFRHQWDPDISNYMDRVRRLLNDPLKRGNKEIAQAFGRYSGAQELKRGLEKQFEATLIDGDTFSPKTEQFANNLLGTSKDEVVRSLRKLDSFLESADDRVVEDLLDVAATESLEKTIQFMGVAQRTLIGSLQGQIGIAAGAAAVQTPTAKVLRALIGRGTAVGGKELIVPSQTQENTQ